MTKSNVQSLPTISQIDPKKITYIDEAGVDNRLFRVYARAARGQKIHADIPGRKRERYSMIGGLMNRKFIAPFTFQGGCNSNVFNTWLENILLHQLPKGTTVSWVMQLFIKQQKPGN